MNKGAKNRGRHPSEHALTPFDLGPPSTPGCGHWRGLLKEELRPSSLLPFLPLPGTTSGPHIPVAMVRSCHHCLGLGRGGGKGYGWGAQQPRGRTEKWNDSASPLPGWWASHRRKAERLHSHPWGRLRHLPRGHLSQPQTLTWAQLSEGSLSEGSHPWQRWVGKLRLRRGHYALCFTEFTVLSHMSSCVICYSPWPNFSCFDFKTWGSKRTLKMLSYFELLVCPLLKFLFESSTLSL